MFSNLSAEMTRARITAQNLAQILEKSEVTISYKINGIKDWNLKEMLKTQEYINSKLQQNYTLDYLFKRDEAFDNKK